MQCSSQVLECSAFPAAGRSFPSDGVLGSDLPCLNRIGPEKRGTGIWDSFNRKGMILAVGCALITLRLRRIRDVRRWHSYPGQNWTRTGYESGIRQGA